MLRNPSLNPRHSRVPHFRDPGTRLANHMEPSLDLGVQRDIAAAKTRNRRAVQKDRHCAAPPSVPRHEAFVVLPLTIIQRFFLLLNAFVASPFQQLAASSKCSTATPLTSCCSTGH